METAFPTEDKLPLSVLLKTHASLKNISPRTLLRWTQRRTRGHLLESTRVGGRTMSSLGAVDRYLSAINTPRDDGGADVSVRSPHERRAASEAAAGELERIGA